ncbi:hypothetical protein MRX96_042873 [Rhipicephalus microplus]
MCVCRLAEAGAEHARGRDEDAVVALSPSGDSVVLVTLALAATRVVSGLLGGRRPTVRRRSRVWDAPASQTVPAFNSPAVVVAGEDFLRFRRAASEVPENAIPFENERNEGYVRGRCLSAT